MHMIHINSKMAPIGLSSVTRQTPIKPIMQLQNLLLQRLQAIELSTLKKK